jgi:hypothetical protein
MIASSSVLSKGVLSRPIEMYCSYHFCTSPFAGSALFTLRTIVSSLCVLPPHPSSVLACEWSRREREVKGAGGRGRSREQEGEGGQGSRMEREVKGEEMRVFQVVCHSQSDYHKNIS